MNWKGWALLGIIVALVAIAAAAVYLVPQEPAAPEDTESDAADGGDLEGQNLYASGEYGFTLQYPAEAQLEESFSPEYHLAPTWRANAGPDEEGTPVLAAIAYETESDVSYPRYYRAMVRIGVSKESGAVAQCEKADTDVGEEALGATLINGTKWQTFSFQDAGMMQYVKGVSYRTLHEGTCFAMEAIAAGSSYRDEPNESDLPEEELTEAYASLTDIVRSFAFAAP